MFLNSILKKLAAKVYAIDYYGHSYRLNYRIKSFSLQKLNFYFKMKTENLNNLIGIRLNTKSYLQSVKVLLMHSDDYLDMR